jgi:hypothetical protein
MTQSEWEKLPWDTLRFPRAVLSPQKAAYVLRAHGLTCRLPKPGWVINLGQGRALENEGGAYRAYNATQEGWI